jgi:hypothetical protein
MTRSRVLAALAFALAGCGGTARPAATASPAPDPARVVAFVACLRAHGIDVPDAPAGTIPKVDTTDPRLRAALLACRELRPPGLMRALRARGAGR